MARKKVSLTYIRNDSDRKASFKKRKKGLIKKVTELSTLCGVEACAVIYSPFDPEPEVWPSIREAQATLARFRKLPPMDQSRKMVNQESFTTQRIKKADDQLRRVQKENRFKELQNFMFACINGQVNLRECTNLPDPAEMNWVIQQTLRDIRARKAVLEAEQRRQLQAPGPQPQAVLPPPALPQPQMPPPPPPPALQEDSFMESFPWNLVQSPGAAEVEGGVIGWVDELAQPPNSKNY